MTTTEPAYVITSVSFDPDVLYEADSYRHELRRTGTVTTRSALVNTALLFYLQHVRARQHDAHLDALARQEHITRAAAYDELHDREDC